MKKIILAVMMMILLCCPVYARRGLDGFLHDLNIQARANMNGFAMKIST